MIHIVVCSQLITKFYAENSLNFQESRGEKITVSNKVLFLIYK